VSPSPSAGLCPHASASTSPRSPGAVPGRLPDASLVEHVCHLYECEQLSTYQVAEIVGVGRQRVGRIVRNAGIVVKPRGAGRRRQPDPRAELIKDLYVHRGMSSTAIAALTGIPSRTIRDWLHARGVSVRTRGPIRREDRLAAPAEA
jgi:plasmid maintenance system antidote protein VapI